jgi:hypothetical protein
MCAPSLTLIGDAMLPKPEPACLVMADISGYTGYLAGVELDHAQDILADLIDTIVGALRPPFQLSKLEGDAAFVYLVAPGSSAGHDRECVFHIPPAAA